MGLKITPVHQGNLAQAIEAAVELFGESDRSSIEEELKSSTGPRRITAPSAQPGPRFDGSKYFVAEHDGKVAGITGYYHLQGHREDAWLGWTGVLPEYRQHKLGTALMTHAFNAAAQAGVNNLRIWTTVEEKYAQARHIYKKAGFTEEAYKPEAEDAASLIVVFSKSARPQAEGTRHLWKHAAYPVDCDLHEIPLLNKQYGLPKNAVDAEERSGTRSIASVLSGQNARLKLGV